MQDEWHGEKLEEYIQGRVDDALAAGIPPGVKFTKGQEGQKYDMTAWFWNNGILPARPDPAGWKGDYRSLIDLIYERWLSLAPKAKSPRGSPRAAQVDTGGLQAEWYEDLRQRLAAHWDLYLDAMDRADAIAEEHRKMCATGDGDGGRKKGREYSLIRMKAQDAWSAGIKEVLKNDFTYRMGDRECWVSDHDQSVWEKGVRSARWHFKDNRPSRRQAQIDPGGLQQDMVDAWMAEQAQKIYDSAPTWWANMGSHLGPFCDIARKMYPSESSAVQCDLGSMACRLWENRPASAQTPHPDLVRNAQVVPSLQSEWNAGIAERGEQLFRKALKDLANTPGPFWALEEVARYLWPELERQNRNDFDAIVDFAEKRLQERR
jgi:hypothetical protein